MKANYANRGKGLEDTILYASSQYKNKELAQIDKIDTPKVIGKGYAYYKERSILDFIGTAKCVNGKLITFDAKESKGNRFPLKNIKEHQIKIMENYIKYGGIAFLIIYMVNHNRYYRIDATTVFCYYHRWKANPKKRGYGSITIEDLEKTTVLKSSNGIVLDYLEGL